MNSDRNGAVYQRAKGGDYKKVADRTPVALSVSAGETYDIEVRGRISFFRVFSGGQQNVSANSFLNVRTDVYPDYPRLIAVVAGLLGGGLTLLWRKHRRTATELSATERRAALAEASGGTPKQIGPYRIVEPIGKGGMARVYKAEDAHGDLYALKVPEEDDERSRREWRILHRMNHPSIVGLRDFHLSDDPEFPSYLVMELLQGQPLDRLLEKRGRLGLPEASRYLKQLLEGLEYAHATGIVHRDLKPANLFIEDRRLRIVDFGVAKVQDQSLTVTGEMVGTPAYSAPEQVESKSADARSDLYSVGVIAYQMLAGQLPWDSKDPLKMLLQKAKGPRRPLEELNPAVTAEIASWIAHLMQNQPEQRPASAAEALGEMPF